MFLSHPTFHKKNLEYVIEVLLDNAYLIDLVFNKINTRIKEHIRRITLIKKPEMKSEKDRKMLVFPYIKNVSETINSAIDKKIYDRL